MIAIVDYGVGNLFSLRCSLQSLNLDAVVTADPAAIHNADRVILPGVGAFGDAIDKLRATGLDRTVGSVVPMQGTIPPELKIPQMGWNALIQKRPHPLLAEVKEGDCVYFVHSFYAADCDDSLVATTEYGRELTAVVAKDNVMGCQFHPEKSGSVGLKILRAFSEMA